MLNPNEKCAVFLDIDGTLIADSYKIPEENLNAIERARAKGHLVFINTGRSWANIPQELRSQFKLDGVIAGSGAMASLGDKLLFNDSVPHDLLKRLYDYLFNHREYRALFEGTDNIYVLSEDAGSCKPPQIPLETKEDYLKMFSDEIQVIAVGLSSHEEFKEEFKDELSFFQFDDYFDIVVNGVNKARGMERVLEITGVRRENTIAVGDSNNDYDMINYAGIGVAMANSTKELLEIADYVTASNRECGVARAIEKFLL